MVSYLFTIQCKGELNMNLINNLNVKLPSNFPYDFSWVAEYNSGNLLMEYNPNLNPKTTSFYDINKQNLLRFGYVGSGLKAHFNTYDGVYNINNSKYSIYLKHENKMYNITEMLGVRYNDIIQFKRRKAFFDPLNGEVSGGMDKNNIESYNVGWKTKLNIGIISFSVTTYYQINRKGLPILYIKLVPSESFDNAEITIVKDNVLEYSYPCSMTKDVGGELNWVVR